MAQHKFRTKLIDFKVNFKSRNQFVDMKFHVLFARFYQPFFYKYRKNITEKYTPYQCNIDKKKFMVFSFLHHYALMFLSVMLFSFGNRNSLQ